MESRKLGHTDLSVSAVGVGCNNFGLRLDLAQSRLVIDKAIDRGINFFDTADVYGNRGGSETILGEALGARRKNVVLATKFGVPMSDDGRMKGGSRRYVLEAAEASLRRLKTDWIDLYQLHFPDPETPIEETLRGLEDLRQQGKVRFIGCSNFTAPQLIAADEAARSNKIGGFASCQMEYSLLSRGIEAAVLPEVEKQGLGLLPFYPLASGFLSGKYRKGASIPTETRLSKPNAGFHEQASKKYLTDAAFSQIEALEDFARTRGHSLLELAFSWLLSRKAVASVIAGASSPEQIESNANSASWRLTSDEKAEVDRLLKSGLFSAA